MKILNHSGIRDEVQDFELNIRAVSGGAGLITLADGVTPDPTVANFGAPTTGRSRLLDDLTFYVAHSVRTPISPIATRSIGRNANGKGDKNENGDGSAESIQRGRALFAASNCQSCHGGDGWSVARVFFTPPPDPALISGGQIVSLLRNVGTFDPNAINEVRDNVSAPPLGAAGFVPPSLLGAHGLAPYLHNGSAQTFEDLLQLVAHRSAGTGGVDLLTSATDRRDLAAFLASIDSRTEPFRLTTVAGAKRGDGKLTASTTNDAFHIERVAPSPTRGPSTIVFTLPKEEDVTVGVYDLIGRRIATVASGVRSAGRHEVRWSGSTDAGNRAWPGVYFVRVAAEGRSEQKSITVVP
jgi:hypothetical protein